MTRLRPASRAAQPFWALAGWISLLLGGIGLLLPVVPTTPFVLLAAFCFGRGAPRLRARLLGTATFGPAIADWETRGAIPRRAKVLGCGLMAITLTGSVLVGLEPWVLGVQAVFMGAAALFILTRPS